MPSYTYACAAHPARVLRRLDELRLRGAFCDVTVQVDGRRFHAHRAVLASCSDYFAGRLHREQDVGHDVTLPPEVRAARVRSLWRVTSLCLPLWTRDVTSVSDVTGGCF